VDVLNDKEHDNDNNNKDEHATTRNDSKENESSNHPTTTITSSSSSSNKKEDLVEARMAELALHLQLETQSCHNTIETVCIETSASLPRAAADVSRLSVGLGGMKMDAEGLLRDVG